MSGAFYRAVDPDILQGDIFRDVPHLFLKPPLQAIRGPIALSKGRTGWGMYAYPLPLGGGSLPVDQPKIGGPFQFREGEQVPVSCNMTLGMVLNHECDIENEPEHRVIALVRPLGPVQNPEHRRIIQGNRNSAYFYLPRLEGVLEEAYVDFRRITSLSPDFLTASNRLTALSPIAVQSLQAQLFRHFAHRLLRKATPGLIQGIKDFLTRLFH